MHTLVWLYEDTYAGDAITLDRREYACQACLQSPPLPPRPPPKWPVSFLLRPTSLNFIAANFACYLHPIRIPPQIDHRDGEDVVGTRAEVDASSLAVFESLEELLEACSPRYRQAFAHSLAQRLVALQLDRRSGLKK